MEVCCPTHMIMLVSEGMLAFKHFCNHALDLAITFLLDDTLAPMCVMIVVFVVDFVLVLMHLPAMIIDMILDAVMQRRGS